MSFENGCGLCAMLNTPVTGKGEIAKGNNKNCDFCSFKEC